MQDAAQCNAALRTLRDNILPLVASGRRMWVSCEEERRTTPQNSRFHAIAGDLARSPLVFAGKRRSGKEWKVLLVSGHATATGAGSEVIPGIEHEFVAIRESTALMSISRGSSLIEYAAAFCALNGVEPSDPNDYLRWGLA